MNEASTSSIYITECNFFTTTSWILDSGCSAHIYVDLQGLNNRRKLQPSEVDLRATNSAKIVALAVGCYTISLPENHFI